MYEYQYTYEDLHTCSICNRWIEGKYYRFKKRLFHKLCYERLQNDFFMIPFF